MKLNKNERFVELFRIGDQITELTTDALRKAVKPVNWQHDYLNLKIREHVTEIEFAELGFKGLNTLPLKELPTAIEGIGDSHDIERVMRNNFLGIVVKSFDYDDETNAVTYCVAPNYLANIKNGEIYNIFDSIERLKYYNFLTDITNKSQNSWRILTAYDRTVKLSQEELDKHYPWKSKPSIESSIKSTASTSYNDIEDNLPVEEVNRILMANNISLLKTNYTLHSLARELKVGIIDENDIINLKQK